jgi:hypothetical protein
MKVFEAIGQSDKNKKWPFILGYISKESAITKEIKRLV